MKPTAPPKAETAAKAAAPASDSVKEKVLALVAGKTGYPVDMLDLDLDLEADLGVDTVKQAEIFAAIRETYGIQRDDTIKLRDFPTLNHVIRFVLDRKPQFAGAATATPVVAAEVPSQVAAPAPVAVVVVPAADAAPTTAAPSAPVGGAEGAAEEVKQRILAMVVEKTGYPADMLDLDLDLEADLGVDTVKQAEMFAAIREMYNIPRDESRKLRDYPTLGARHPLRL